MLKVRDIMTPDPEVISPDQTAEEANRLLEARKIGSLPVVEDGRLVGILTSRDLRLSHPNRLVADLMTRNVITVSPETSLWEAQEILGQHGIERLVVVDKNGRVVGIVTETVILGKFWRYWDPLTRLPRSEILHKKGENLLQEGKEISLIFLDLDNFGAIDKEHGHVIGDNILQVVASIFAKCIDRERDFLCRYAGDEFAVLSTRTLREAVALAGEMVSALEEHQWAPGILISSSAGVAGGRRKGGRGERPDLVISELINLASLASTRAKKEKKRVAVAGRIEWETVDNPAKNSHLYTVRF